MRTRRHLLGIAALSILLVACTSPADGPDPDDPEQLEVFTTWTSPAEKAGLTALLDLFRDAHPGMTIFDSSIAVGVGGDGDAALQARLEAGNAPDSAQVRAGARLDQLVASRLLEDVGTIVDASGLGEALPAVLSHAIATPDGTFAVPVAIHRANVVWVGYDALLAAGIQPADRPAGTDEWLANLAALRADGIEYPLALGTSWTRVLLFENVLLADLGPDTYDGLWTGATQWDGAFVKQAIVHYAALLDFADPRASGDQGDAVASRVASGEAVYAVLPDSAAAVFRDAGLEYGTEYAGLPTPGTEGVFDVYADALALPTGASHPEAARKWLAIAATAAAQLVFAEATGAVPARDDVDLTALSTFQRTNGSSYTSDALVASAAFGAAARPGWVAEITKAVERFDDDRQAGAFVAALAVAAEEWTPER